eukprot:m.70341 g.70341  ORF g.70341 m.70341 type:complete len:201 (+) comp50130_c0_seq3:167-769(+)
MSLRLIARSFANTQMRLVLPATSATARVATRHISFFGGKEEGKAPADGAQPAAAAAPGQPEPTEQEKLISKQAEEIASLTDKYKRSLAEAENARRRADLEVHLLLLLTPIRCCRPDSQTRSRYSGPKRERVRYSEICQGHGLDRRCSPDGPGSYTGRGQEVRQAPRVCFTSSGCRRDLQPDEPGVCTKRTRVLQPCRSQV